MSASTELQSIQEQIKAELANIHNSVAPPSSNRISTRDKKFTLPDGTSHAGPMYAVVLDHRNFNRYYTKPYDPQNPTPPDCFAIAKDFDSMSPYNHEGVKDPQSNDCASCPMNQFGSGPTGKGKACRNMVRLALARPDASANDDPMTLEVPPSALKHWNKHVNHLQTAGMLPVQVITEISFDPQAAFPCPTFGVSEAHDNLDLFWSLREKAQAILDQEPAT